MLLIDLLAVSSLSFESLKMAVYLASYVDMKIDVHLCLCMILLRLAWFNVNGRWNGDVCCLLSWMLYLLAVSGTKFFSRWWTRWWWTLCAKTLKPNPVHVLACWKFYFCMLLLFYCPCPIRTRHYFKWNAEFHLKFQEITLMPFRVQLFT